MGSRNCSIVVIGVLAVTLTGCAGTPQNTSACRELLNIEGELSTLVNSTTARDDELLPGYLTLADAAKHVDADGEVKAVALTLGDVAQDLYDALEPMNPDSTVDSSIFKAYIDASIDMQEACEPFLP